MGEDDRDIDPGASGEAAAQAPRDASATDASYSVERLRGSDGPRIATAAVGRSVSVGELAGALHGVEDDAELTHGELAQRIEAFRTHTDTTGQEGA